MKITIFIPFFNENEGISNLKEKITPLLKQLTDQGYNFELLLLDDGSTDNTWDKLHLYFKNVDHIRFLQHRKNQNLGGGIRTAVKECTGDLLVLFDSDCTYNPMDIVGMITLQNKENADVVIASVYHPKGRVKGLPYYRLIPSYTASWIYRQLTKSGIYTYTGLFRIYKINVLRKITIESDGFIVCAEILLKLIKINAKIVEFPTTVGIRKFNASKMKFINTTLAHFKLMRDLVSGKLG